MGRFGVNTSGLLGVPIIQDSPDPESEVREYLRNHARDEVPAQATEEHSYLERRIPGSLLHRRKNRR
jgi:hypothetical protein